MNLFLSLTEPVIVDTPRKSSKCSLAYAWS